MCKNLIDIFTKIPCRYFLFSVVFLLVTCYWADAAWALEGYNENNGYSCPGMDVLKERYQGDCFPCEMVNILLTAFMRAASAVYDVSKEAGNKLLLLGSAIWLGFWALSKISSLASVEPSSMTNELIIFLGKVLVAYCFINAGIGTLVNFAINPIMGAGAEFGSALLLETENIDVTSAPKAENQYSGPTDLISKSVMDKILKLSEAVSNEVATNFIIGSGLTCFSIQNGLHIQVPGFIDIHIPDIWLWLCGAAIWCVGFMLVLAVCYYLVDIPFKIGFAIIALPVVIGLWPFKVTAGKLKSIIGIALNAAFTFLFLALSSSYAIRLISQSFSSEGDLVVDGQTYSGKEALFKAFEVDNVEFVQSLFDFTGPAFLIILFCYIYGFKMISSITNDFPNKFDTGMTSAAGSPIHHMATAATMWTTGKIAQPFKTGMSIITHQAGKAATTVTKAAANVGIGVAGAAVGAGGKFIGRGINKATSKWADSQRNLKAAADSLDKYNKLNQVGTGAKLQGKLGKLGATVSSGIAGSINKLGQNLERGGDALMNPGRNTLERVVTAAKTGGAEVKAASKELGGALSETAAALTPEKLAAHMGAAGQKILEIKSSMKEQAHQDFANSVQKFAQSRQQTAQKLVTAFASVKGGVDNLRSGETKNRLLAMMQSKIKYVTGGSLKKDVKSSFAQMKARTASDVQRSKDRKIQAQDIGQNFKQNIQIVEADLREAGHSLMHGHMEQNWQNLKKDLSELKNTISTDTGIQNKFGVAAVTASGIGLGIAAARHLATSAKNNLDYVKDGEVHGVMSAIGTGVVRPSVALGMTVAQTAGSTLESAYKLTRGSVLAGIGVAQTLLSPVGNLTRSAAHVGMALGDTGLTLASTAGTLVGMATSRLNVAYQYSKYATRPVSKVLGLPFRGAGMALGFAAKTVDNSLYAGYRAVAGIGQGAGVVGRGANVLYHGVKDRTVVGQAVSKTLKSGSKTLKLAAKTLKLGRNVILAAAGEDTRSPQKETKAERREKNRQYLEKQKQRRQKEAQKKKEKERQQRREERQREEDENWRRYEEENRAAEEAKEQRQKAQQPKPAPVTPNPEVRSPRPVAQKQNDSRSDKQQNNNRPAMPANGEKK